MSVGLLDGAREACAQALQGTALTSAAIVVGLAGLTVLLLRNIGPSSDAERLGEAAGLLAQCFHANPNFVGLFPDQRARSRAFPRMFTAGLRDGKGRARAER